MQENSDTSCLSVPNMSELVKFVCKAKCSTLFSSLNENEVIRLDEWALSLLTATSGVLTPAIRIHY